MCTDLYLGIHGHKFILKRLKTTKGSPKKLAEIVYKIKNSKKYTILYGGVLYLNFLFSANKCFNKIT